DRFTRSLMAAAAGEPVPEDGYAGQYVRDIASAVLERSPGVLELAEQERAEVFRSIGVGLMFDHIKRTLAEFGTSFDVFFHEASLFDSGAVDAAVAELKASGTLYEADGAWWIRSSEFGDDKDRVV